MPNQDPIIIGMILTNPSVTHKYVPRIPITYIIAPVFEDSIGLNLLVAIMFFVPTYSYRKYDGRIANHIHILIPDNINLLMY